MAQHKISPLVGQDDATARILDFEAAKAARLAGRLAASEIAAAQALAAARGGDGSLQDLLRALIAPYNNDPC